MGGGACTPCARRVVAGGRHRQLAAAEGTRKGWGKGKRDSGASKGMRHPSDTAAGIQQQGAAGGWGTVPLCTHGHQSGARNQEPRHEVAVVSQWLRRAVGRIADW